MSGNRTQNTLIVAMLLAATGAFALPVLAQQPVSPPTEKAPILPQPVTPAGSPAKSEVPMAVPPSYSPIDVEQVKPEKDVTLKPTAPNLARPKITTRDGLAAEQ